MEENFVDFKCPYCGEMASFPETAAGRVQKCPHCPESLLVPAEPSEFGGKLPASVATPRLQLRRFQAADWKPLLELMSDEALLKYVPWHPLEETEVERWIEHDREVRLMQEQDFFLGIELTAESQFIGLAALHFRDENRQAGFTLIIHPKFQRQGFGLETCGGLLAFVFSGLNLHRVNVACDSRNEAGRKMLDKAGLRREGEFVKESLVKGEWINHVWYAALGEEYNAWPEERKKGVLNL